MKKNAMLKIAAILMVAVLLTTCAISSTFAKYASASSATDTARVAKFGITTTVAFDGFDDVYEKDATGHATITNSVDSADGKNVLAPGTTKTIAFDSNVDGTAEVAVNVTTAVEILVNDKWDNNYFPVYFTVDGTTYKHKSIDDNSTYTTIEALLAAVAEDASITKDYAANEEIADEANASSITWTWDFQGDQSVDTDGNGVSDADELDMKYADGAPTITINVATTITQID